MCNLKDGARFAHPFTTNGSAGRPLCGIPEQPQHRFRRFLPAPGHDQGIPQQALL